MTTKSSLIAGAMLLSPAMAVAQDALAYLWISPGLYGLEQSACSPAELRSPAIDISTANDTANVAPAFCPLLDTAHRQRAGARFVQLATARFPLTEARFAAHLPKDATPRARLAGTLVVSMRLTRASIWSVVKGPVTDAYLPITLTLDITNMGTAEVVFTRTRSVIGRGSFASGAVEAGLTGQFEAQLDNAMVMLVDEAVAAWKPYPITGAVRARVDGGWLLDKGRQAGLREGDTIGPDGRVAFSGPDYAVVAPALGEYAIGQNLSRTVSQPAEMLARPTVLTFVAAAPAGYPRPYLTQLFEDALGNAGRLAALPVNPGFAGLRAMVIGEAQQLSTDTRSLPDYIARLTVAAVAPTSIPSNVPGVVVDTSEAHVFVELLDRSGRVVFTAHGSDRIVDESAGGVRFAPEQRRDTTIRNAMLNAATKISAFRQQPASLPIAEHAGRLEVSDPGGALPLNAQAVVLRDLGRVGGISGVRIPVGQIRTDEFIENGVTATNAGVGPLRLKSGDLVYLDGASPATATRRAVSQCADQAGTPRFDDRGEISPAIWHLAAGVNFASTFGAPVYVTGANQSLQQFENQFAGWTNLQVTRARTVDYCFVPVMAMMPTTVAQSKSGLSARRFSLTIGYTLFRDNKKIAGGGLQSEITGTGIPSGTDPITAESVLERDFAAVALPLSIKAAAALVPPKQIFLGN